MSFSFGGAGGFGQNNQQQQQPQQSTFGSTFGGGGAFGGGNPTTPAFGAPATPSLFGQPAQPAQQSGFGTFGAQSQQPATGGLFGQSSSTPAFGAAPQQQPQTTGLFGSAAPAATNTGFSFGGTQNNQPSGGGLFGSSSSAMGSTPAFGAPKPAFGASGSMFGGGATGMSSGFGGQQQPSQFGAVQAPTQPGTAHTPWQAHAVQDPKEGAGALPVKQMFQSISAMDEYNKYSVEELRVQDYAANRKYASAGAPQQQQSTFGGFGTSAAPAASPFGTPASQPPAYGQFGQPSTSSAGGLFGNAATTTSTFGAASSAPTMFGATPAPTPATNAFGGGATGAFGAPKPGGFSFGGASTSTAAPSTGLFGAANNAPAATTSAFGQPNTNSGGLFGNAGQPQQAAQPNTGFSFGGAAASKPSLFGSTPAPAPTTSLFGAQPQQQPAAAKPTFGFGQPAASGSLFGSTPAQPQQNNAFGAPAPAASGGMFGNLGGQSTNTGGLFGSKPTTTPAASGGLFGSTNNGAPSLFGQPQQQQQQQQQQPAGSLFGQNSTSSLFGGGLSTASQPQQPAQQQAYATADAADAYGSNPLFTNVNFPSPANASADDKKKPPIFTAFRGTPINRSSTKITRLRGFGTPTASPTNTRSTPFGQSTKSGSPLVFNVSIGSPSTPGSGGRASPLRLVNGIGDEVALSPNAFVSRPSVKKLVIGRKTPGDSSMIKSTDDSASPSKDGTTTTPGRPRVTFNPEVDIPSRERHFQSSILGQRDDESEHGTPVKKSTSGNFLGGSGGFDESSFESAAPRRQPRALKHGEYATTPSIEHLQSLPASALKAVSNLEVRRQGYGRIHFNEPVDLTTLPSVEELCGGIIQFEDRNCTVYPADYEPKPRRGSGLNVPATITLERCWPVDKTNRQPIKDPEHPRLVAHIKRLKNLEATTFEDFAAATGEWRFSVEGF